MRNDDEGLAIAPTTSVSATAHRRLVCPVHGHLDGVSLRCPLCNKRGYDLSDVDERAILTSIRRVERSERLNRARVFGYPTALFAMITLLGFGAPTYVVTIFAGEALARGIARIMRRTDPGRVRAVDDELSV